MKSNNIRLFDNRIKIGVFNKGCVLNISTRVICQDLRTKILINLCCGPTYIAKADHPNSLVVDLIANQVRVPSEVTLDHPRLEFTNLAKEVLRGGYPHFCDCRTWLHLQYKLLSFGPSPIQVDYYDLG